MGRGVEGGRGRGLTLEISQILQPLCLLEEEMSKVAPEHGEEEVEISDWKSEERVRGKGGRGGEGERGRE